MFAFEKATTHQIAANYWVKSNGAPTDLQKQEISMADALKFWGVDNTKTEAGIHWGHAGKGAIALARKPYILDAKGDTIDVEVVNSVSWPDDNKYESVIVDFKADYAYPTREATVAKDVILNGKNTLYIPIKFTATDNADVTDIVRTDYEAVLKVDFKALDVESLYEWNSGKPIVASYGTDLSGTFKSTKDKDAAGTAVISLNVPSVQTYNAKGEEVALGDATAKYVVPGVTVSGQLGEAYKKALADADKVGYASDDAKKEAYAKIKLAFMNAVTGSTWHSNGAVYQSWMNIKSLISANSDTFEWVVTTSAGNGTEKLHSYASGSNEFKIQSKHLTTTDLPSAISGNYDEYNKMIDEGKYTINGLTATVMGREVALPGLEVAILPAQVPAVGQIVVNPSDTKLNKTGVSYFYNAVAPAGVTNNFDGAFALKDENDKTVVLTSASTVSITDGFAATKTPSGGTSADIDAENLTVSVLNYTDGATTPAQQYGIKIDVKSQAGLNVGDTVKIPLTITNVKVANLPDSEPQTLKVELTIVVK